MINIQDADGHERPFPFSFILCEDSPLPSAESPINDLASAFVVDCLIGNWRLFGFTTEDHLRHIVVHGNSLARRSAESAFGVVYQDDRMKKRPIIEWRDTSVPELDQLKRVHSWVYGQLSDEDVARQIAYIFQAGVEKHIKALFAAEGTLCDQLGRRVYWLQQRLNWFPLPIVTSSTSPCPRDGHTAVIVGSGENRRMIVFGGSTGGNTEGNPIGDVWSLNLRTCLWSRIAESTQELARYSHTATLWKDRYMVVIGGALSNKAFLNDVQVFDCEQCRWLTCTKTPADDLPKLARHAAVLYNANFIMVYGGSPEQGKKGGKRTKKYQVLDSIYSLKLALSRNNGGIEYGWMLRKPTTEERPEGMHRHSLVCVGKKICLISKEANQVIWRLDVCSVY